ncbi:MAG: polysaccharide deacetylase family protein [Armatimonadetes bacterium]|nr:polysaccharide deacetylase family protein [Armatimonadota bacterium]
MRLLARMLALALPFALVVGCQKPDAPKKPDAGTKQEEVTPPKPDDPHGDPPAETDICFDAQNRRTPIIMFHDLVEKRGKDTVWYDCTTEEFKDILDKIKEDGLTVISLNDLCSHLATGKEIPEKSIVLTFDDNYQSFYDIAWPMLRERQYPATVFVHTAFVGSQQGRPKMSWDTLKELVKDPLFTVGGHTINHYEDLKDRDLETQRHELTDSKTELESKLGVKIDLLAYPNGSNGEDTQAIAREAGYKLAVTVENMPAEESPNIFAVGRYIQTRFKNAVEDCEKAADGAPADVFRMKWNKDAKVHYVDKKFAGIPLRMVIGGIPETVMSPSGRQPVKEIVEQEGGVAGINGGFFAMAAVASTDNAMVGPLKTTEMGQVAPDQSPERWPKINDRPLVIWSKDEFALLPYVPAQMNKSDQYEYFMRAYTDCFMGGVWLVHKGVARTRDQQDVFGAKDIQDPRRRAFIGIMADGEFVAGTVPDSVSSSKLAEAAAEAGVQEAVLIDSGFSTSLVFNDKIKASGHSNRDHPSRPVPHAIVIKGEIDATTDDSEDLSTATSLEPETGSRRRRKR